MNRGSRILGRITGCPSRSCVREGSKIGRRSPCPSMLEEWRFRARRQRRARKSRHQIATPCTCRAEPGSFRTSGDAALTARRLDRSPAPRSDSVATGDRPPTGCGLLASGRIPAVSRALSANAGVDDAGGAPDDDDVAGAWWRGLGRQNAPPALLSPVEQVKVAFTAELQEDVRVDHAADAISQYGRYPSYIIG